MTEYVNQCARCGSSIHYTDCIDCDGEGVVLVFPDEDNPDDTGYECPVADAIYRLTEERDALKAELDERRAMPYRTQADQEFFDAEWERTKAWMEVALDATRAPSAVGGAPGVSETHTDPKEAPR